MGSQFSPEGLRAGTAASQPPHIPSPTPHIKTEGEDDTVMGGVGPVPLKKPAEKEWWWFDGFPATKIKQEEMEHQDVPVLPSVDGRNESGSPTLTTAVNATADALSVMGVAGAPAETDKYIPFNQGRLHMLSRPKIPSPSPEAEEEPQAPQQTKTNCIPLEYNRVTGEKLLSTPTQNKTHDSDFLPPSQKEKTRSDKIQSSPAPRKKYYRDINTSPVPASKRARRSSSRLGGGEDTEKKNESQYRQRRSSRDRDSGRSRYRHRREASPDRDWYHDDREVSKLWADHYRPSGDRYRPSSAKGAAAGNPLLRGDLQGLIRDAHGGKGPATPSRVETAPELSRVAWGDHLHMGLDEKIRFGSLPGRDWVPAGFNSLAINSPDPRSFEQPQPMMSNFARQFPFQSAQLFPQLGRLPGVAQFPQFPGVQMDASGMIQHQPGSQFQFGGSAQQKPLYPPAIPAIKYALRPFVTFSPLAASDPADPSDHGPRHFVLEWAGHHQLKLLAMELLHALGLDQDGQRRDLRVCLSHFPRYRCTYPVLTPLQGLASVVVSDRCLVRVASFYPPQLPIQTPRYFRAYVGAINESNREVSGVVNIHSQQELRQWFFELFLPVVEDLAKNYTLQPKQKPSSSSAESSLDSAGRRGWGERMEAIKKRKNPYV